MKVSSAKWFLLPIRESFLPRKFPRYTALLLQQQQASDVAIDAINFHDGIDVPMYHAICILIS